MTRTEEILNYANSFKGKGMENEELKEIIRLAIIDGAMWADKHPITDNDIEYIRKDAFIERACDYLMEYEFNDSPTIADRRKRIDEFRNYMKGE